MTSSVPSISVVIPLYNKEKYIARAIDSVLAQTVQDFELIVVNDGSKDQGAKIVQGFHDSRIHLINQDNQGASTARNRGILEAATDLVAFLDADDVWYQNFLETILRLYEEFPNAGMYGTAYAVYSDGKLRRNNIWRPEDGMRVLPYYRDFVLAGYPPIITSSFAAPKHVLKIVGGYNPNFRAGQDHDLFSRLAAYFDVAYSPNICSQYNAGSENNVDMVHYVLEIPFESYADVNRLQLMRECTCYNDLLMYLNFWRLKTGARNIYSGFKAEGRIQLRMVTPPWFLWKKMLFMILSYVPFSLSCISPKVVRRITNKLRLSA